MPKPIPIRDITIINDLGGNGRHIVVSASLTGPGIRTVSTDWIIQWVTPGGSYLLTQEPQPGFVSTMLNPLIRGALTNNVTEWQADAYGPAQIPVSTILRCVALVGTTTLPTDLAPWMVANAWQVRIQVDNGHSQPTPWSPWQPQTSPGAMFGT